MIDCIVPGGLTGLKEKPGKTGATAAFIVLEWETCSLCIWEHCALSTLHFVTTAQGLGVLKLVFRGETIATIHIAICKTPFCQYSPAS